MDNLYSTLLYSEFILAVIIFVLLIFITAPYGRFGRKGWGPSLSSRAAWMIMEMPSFIIPVLFALFHNFSAVSFVFVIIWLSHYLHRTIIYPFRISDPGKPFFLIIMLWGFIFNLMNSYVNFYFIFRIRPVDDISWFLTGKFLGGITLFVTGYIINKNSDAILRSLRKRNTENYSIPYRGLFRWISSPNYFGEILEWGGWALLTWSIAGTAFFVFTIANLLPRAMKIHSWYKSEFKEYPQDRKAIIPYIL